MYSPKQSSATSASTNVTWHDHAVTRAQREKLLGQRGLVLWFTGLSGSGKTAIADAVAERLHKKGKLTYLLDGDNVRHGLCKDLGFTPQDRSENIRRVAEVARLFVDAGVITLVSFISPYSADRRLARRLLGSDFVEVFVDAPLSVCEARDPKGLYARARAGEIKNFTGISAPYEAPVHPEIHLNTEELSIEESATKVVAFVLARQ
ncbi:adenylyl-sulfate kinase [Candidatus Woesearchaeota archaeon]|nr:MAG: adenylyl-sulfate kinase [Candidatus Woesearchaeota archaeon]